MLASFERVLGLGVRERKKKQNLPFPPKKEELGKK